MMEIHSCGSCANPITDEYVFRIDGYAWHGTCLRCSVCQCSLKNQPTCYLRENAIYCKKDYDEKFPMNCARCSKSYRGEWVRKTRDSVFHLTCFTCAICNRQLSTGERIAIDDNRVLCEAHYLQLIGDGTSSAEDNSSNDKPKRMRTTFTDDQTRDLQKSFRENSNPDGEDLERIAHKTGLTKRVVQVWFQNARARQKRHSDNGSTFPEQYGTNHLVSPVVPYGQESLNGFVMDHSSNSSINDSPGGSPMSDEFAPSSSLNHQSVFLNVMVFQEGIHPTGDPGQQQQLEYTNSNEEKL